MRFIRFFERLARRLLVLRRLLNPANVALRRLLGAGDSSREMAAEPDVQMLEAVLDGFWLRRFDV